MSFYSISSVKVESDTYFRAKEAATFLGYQNTAKSVRDHASSKYKISARDLVASGVGMPKTGMPDLDTVYLSEAGLYQFAFSSKLPQAEQFREWVFESVLPATRATGSYPLPKTSTTRAY